MSPRSSDPQRRPALRQWLAGWLDAGGTRRAKAYRIADIARAGWQIGIPWFRSEERWVARALLVGVICCELLRVAMWVMMSYWNAALMNALEAKDWNAFMFQMLAYSLVALVIVLQAIGDLTLDKWFTLRWRRWLTARYLDGWLDSGTHYRMRLQGIEPDNPDQRIADDIRLYVERTTTITMGVMRTVVSLASFGTILAKVPSAQPVMLLGIAFSMPVLLLTASFLYATFGTVLSHLIGKRLFDLNIGQQRTEADFRFGLARLRAGSEEVAIARGEAVERAELDHRFAALARNWFALLARERWLKLFQSVFDRVAFLIPYLMAAPLYFSGAMPLGGMTQTAYAFDRIRRDMSYLVRIYSDLAFWVSVVERLRSLSAAIAAAQVPLAGEILHTRHRDDSARLILRDVQLHQPSGAMALQVPNFSLHPGERVLLSGASGIGKTTLVRALAGVWPYGQGKISVAQGARLMAVPQRGYVAQGALRDALGCPGAVDPELRAALFAVGLPALAGQLDSAQFLLTLSGGERQRLAFARILLQRPDILLLDETSSALDEASEQMLYQLLQAQLPDMALLSIGHRQSLAGLHDRVICLGVDGIVEAA